MERLLPKKPGIPSMMGVLRDPRGHNHVPAVCSSREETHKWIDRYYDSLGEHVGTGDEKDPTIRGVLMIFVNLDEVPSRTSTSKKNWILAETNNITPIFTHDETGVPHPTTITFSLRVMDKIPKGMK